MASREARGSVAMAINLKDTCASLVKRISMYLELHCETLSGSSPNADIS